MKKTDTERQTSDRMVSVADLSEELKINHQMIRRYIAYFDLAVEKQGRKMLLPRKSVEHIMQISQLKQNGWSPKDIRELLRREEQQKQEQQQDKQKEQEPRDKEEKKQDSRQEAEDKQQAHSKEDRRAPRTNHPRQEKDTEKQKNRENSAPASSAHKQHKERDPAEKQNRQHLAPPTDTVQTQHQHKIPHTLQHTSSGNQVIHAKQQNNNTNSSKEATHAKTQNNTADAASPNTELTKDSINREISMQARKVARLYKFLGSKHAPREVAELKADLNRRVEFVYGLRYIRDNWIERHVSTASSK